MPYTYRQLDLAERRTIFRLLNAKTPVAVIAREARPTSLDRSIARSIAITSTLSGSMPATTH